MSRSKETNCPLGQSFNKRSAVAIIALCGLITLSHSVSADYETAVTAYVKSDFSEALRQLQPFDSQSDPRSQFLLGQMYFHGNGVERNLETAAYWFKRSADKGEAAAQLALGILYETGQGVQPDNAKAAYWYRFAAHQQLPEAQYRLGQLHTEGEETHGIDEIEALMWLHLAAKQGHREANFAIAKLAQQMTQWQVAEAEKRAHEWKALGPSQLREMLQGETESEVYRTIQQVFLWLGLIYLAIVIPFAIIEYFKW